MEGSAAGRSGEAGGDEPFHKQYETKHGCPIPRPLCSERGISPWVKPSGRRNEVTHVRVPKEVTKVSDVMETSVGADGVSTTTISVTQASGVRVRVDLDRGVILAIEGDCNIGKSFAVLEKLLRPILEQNPRTPLLFWSVRITHALDLYETLRKAFK